MPVRTEESILDTAKIKEGSLKTENFEIISQVAQELQQKFPHLVFGGSWALKLKGLIEREVRDLDVLVWEEVVENKWVARQKDKEFKEICEYLEDSSSTIRTDVSVDFNDDVKQIVKYYYKGIGIDILYLWEKPISEFYDEFNVQRTRDIIRAKQYLVANNKHQLDLNYMLENIN